MSVGLAVSPEDGCDLQALFAAADARLYSAKNAGRNRVWASGSASWQPLQQSV